HAVGLADLLLLTELKAVLADLAPADAALPGRGGPALERALLGVAPGALEVELGALPAADAANGCGVSGHRQLLGHSRRRVGSRQLLRAMRVPSEITINSIPASCSHRSARPRPAPGPLTNTSTWRRPRFIARRAAPSSDRAAAFVEILRESLKPAVPA